MKKQHMLQIFFFIILSCGMLYGAESINEKEVLTKQLSYIKDQININQEKTSENRRLWCDCHNSLIKPLEAIVSTMEKVSKNNEILNFFSDALNINNPINIKIKESDKIYDELLKHSTSLDKIYDELLKESTLLNNEKCSIEKAIEQLDNDNEEINSEKIDENIVKKDDSLFEENVQIRSIKAELEIYCEQW